MAKMKIKMLYGEAVVDGAAVAANTPFDLEAGEAQGLIDRGLAVEVKASGEAKPVVVDTKPPAEVLKKDQHQGIEEVKVAEQLPNKQSQK